MKTSLLKSTLLILATGVLAASCGKTLGELPEENDTISLTSFIGTRADGEEEAQPDRNLQPLFLFWTEGNFGDATKVAPDFFTASPDGEIDSYAETPYNTFVPYPAKNAAVWASGIAPLPGDGYLQFAAADDYTKFTIPANPTSEAAPDDVRGVMDVLAGQTISATNSSRFTVGNPLNFIHAQTRLYFNAKLSATMKKFVKFVTVEFPGSLAPMTVEWNSDDLIYEVKGGVDGTDDFVFGNYNTTANDPRRNQTLIYQLSADKTTSMGYTHLVPGFSSIPVVIRYQMADKIDGFDKGEDINDVVVNTTLSFFESDGLTPIVAAPGDSFTITFVFDVYDIELIGAKRDWEDGGYISVPFQIQPSKD